MACGRVEQNLNTYASVLPTTLVSFPGRRATGEDKPISCRQALLLRSALYVSASLLCVVLFLLTKEIPSEPNWNGPAALTRKIFAHKFLLGDLVAVPAWLYPITATAVLEVFSRKKIIICLKGVPFVPCCVPFVHV